MIDHIVATLEVVLVMLMTVLLRVQAIIAISTELPREAPLHVGWRILVIVAVGRHVEDLELGFWRDLVHVVGGGEVVLVRAAWHPWLRFAVATGRREKPLPIEVGSRPATAVTGGALELDLELAGGRRLPVLLVHAVGRGWVLGSRMARLVLWEWVLWLAMLGIVMTRRLVHHR